MDLSFFTDIQRECFRETAIELMNHYCILKHDSRDNSDIIYRFAEIEFYLYDIKEQCGMVLSWQRCRYSL